MQIITKKLILATLSLLVSMVYAKSSIPLSSNTLTLFNSSISTKIDTLDAYSKYRNIWKRVGDYEPEAAAAGLVITHTGTLYLAHTGWYNARVMVMEFRNKENKWMPLGDTGLSGYDDASYVNLAVAPDGTPYIGFIDKKFGNQARVMRFDRKENKWANVGAYPWFSTGGAFSLNLAIAPDGTLYVAFADKAFGNKIRVVKFKDKESDVWIPVGSPGFSKGEVLETRLAISKKDGIPYVAYSDRGYGYNPVVKKFDGGNWSYIDKPAFSSVGGGSLGFVIDNNDNLYLSSAIMELPSGKMKPEVIKYEKTAKKWVNVGQDVDTEGTSNTTLALASDGTLYLAFTENYTKRLTVLQLIKFPDGRYRWTNISSFGGISPSGAVAI